MTFTITGRTEGKANNKIENITIEKKSLCKLHVFKADNAVSNVLGSKIFE